MTSDTISLLLADLVKYFLVALMPLKVEHCSFAFVFDVLLEVQCTVQVCF